MCRSRGALDFSPHLCCWRCGSAPTGSSQGIRQVMDRQRIRTSECKPKTRRQRRHALRLEAGKANSTLGSWRKCTLGSWEGATTSTGCRIGCRPLLMTIAAPQVHMPARLRRPKSTTSTSCRPPLITIAAAPHVHVPSRLRRPKSSARRRRGSGHAQGCHAPFHRPQLLLLAARFGRVPMGEERSPPEGMACPRTVREKVSSRRRHRKRCRW